MATKFSATIEDFEAEDIRAFYDTEMFRVWMLAGRDGHYKDRTFRIERVQRITKREHGKEQRRAILRLSDRKGKPVPLPLELNPTNRKAISQLYTTKPRNWIGKTITLYATTTDSPQGIVDCIRVRPYVPGSKGPNGGQVNRQGVNVIKPEEAQQADAFEAALEEVSFEAALEEMSDADVSDADDSGQVIK